MATKDGRSQIWYADGNGNVTGYTENAGDYIGTIMDAYNEHFGTDISIWTPETKDLQVGDTVPNWNAYEKIILQTRKIAANYAGPVPNEAYMIGTLTGSIFKVFTNGEGGCICKSDGLVLAYNGPMANNAEYIMQILNNRGLDVDSVENEIVDYEINSYIPNWNEYEKF